MSGIDTSLYLFDLFISYARLDDTSVVDGTIVHPVSELKEALETHWHPHTGEQMRVCTDVQDFDLGGIVEGAIRARLKLSRCLVVICSEASAESPWVPHELAWFDEERPEGQRIGIALDILPQVAFPAWFVAGQLGGDLRTRPGDRLAEWRERLHDESHRIAAAVWELPMLEMFDRWQADGRAAVAMELARKARALLATETDRAALLALAAHSASPTVAATDALMAVGARCRRVVRVDISRRLADVDESRWDPDNRYVAAVSRDGGAVLILRRDGSLFARSTDGTRERHVATVEPGLLPRPAVAISDDQRWAAVHMGSIDDDAIHLFSLKNGGEQRFKLPHRARGVEAFFAFDPTGRTLVVGDGIGGVHALSLTDGTLLWSDRGHRGPTVAVVFPPDGQLVATKHSSLSQRRSTLRLWETGTGRTIRSERIEKCTRGPSVVFTADGLHCIVSQSDKRMTVVPVDPLSPARGLFTGLVGQSVLATGLKGRIAATAGDRIAVWRSLDADGPDTFPSPLDAEAVHMSFAPGQKLLVVADASGAFAVVDSHEQRAVMAPIRAYGGLVAAPMAGARDHELITVHTDATVVTWDIAPAPVVGPFVQSRDGRRIASLRNRKVRIWDGADLTRIGAPLSWKDRAPTAIALSADGTTLAIGSNDRKVRLWDLEAGREVALLTSVGRSLPKQKKGRWRAPTWNLEFAPSGRRLAAMASFDDHGYSRMWDEVLVWDGRASSMNRLVGAVEADVTAATKKIVVAERTIKAIKPDATVTALDARVGAPEVEAVIAGADVVFGCLDRDLPRLQLTELCARYAKPLFDLASDTGGEGEEIWYGGRVVFCDGSRCLVCLDLLDQQEIGRDSMSPEQREAHDRIYGIERGALAGTGPMVVSVNGTVASIAVTEFMVYVSGLREPAAQLTYRGDLQVIRRSVDEPEPGCYFCTGIWGSALG